MATTLTLTFLVGPVTAGRDIVVSITTPGPTLTLTEDFVTLRLEAAQVSAGASPSLQAQKFAIAWNLDYSNQGGPWNLVCVAVGDDAIITILNPSWLFNNPTGTAITSDDIQYVKNNDPFQEANEIIVTGYAAEVGDECESIKANLTVEGGNGTYDVYDLFGNLLASSQTSPFSLTVARNTPIKVEVRDTLGESIGLIKISPPKKIIESQIEILLANLQSGTTLTINVTTSILNNPLQYSLDDITYQVANVYPGLAPDTYTVYVKDGFGCVSSKSAIVVDGVTEVSETVFTMSDINPLRYAKVESGKKNHKNTLSCNEVRQLGFPFYHRYLQDDFIPTQFKTNAQYIKAYTIDSNGVTIEATVLQKTINTGLTAKSTCTMFSLGGGRSAIYFGAVDILNPLNDAVLEQVDFGFSLPEWADTIGDSVIIDGIGELIIDALGYSDLYDAFIIEFNYAYTAAPSAKKLSANYNLQPYEVYEFVISMAGEQSLFNVVIEAGVDSDNIDFCYISEKVKRVVDNDNLAQIEYFDSKNKGQLVYQTGIQFLLRLPFFSDYAGEQKTEGYDGDTQYYITDNVIYDSIKWTFPRLPGEMIAKLRLVCSHEFLKINGIFYKLSAAPEVKTVATNNFKTFIVVLKRSGDQFLTDAQEQISDAVENDAISAAIEASKGKALILWTKTNA